MSSFADEMSEYQDQLKAKAKKIRWFAEKEFITRYDKRIIISSDESYHEKRRKHIEHLIETREDYLRKTYAKEKTLILPNWNDLDLIQAHHISLQIHKIKNHKNHNPKKHDEVIQDLFADSMSIPVLKSKKLMGSADDAEYRISQSIAEYANNDRSLTADLRKLDKMARFSGKMKVTADKYSHLYGYRFNTL